MISPEAEALKGSLAECSRDYLAPQRSLSRWTKCVGWRANSGRT